MAMAYACLMFTGLKYNIENTKIQFQKYVERIALLHEKKIV